MSKPSVEIEEVQGVTVLRVSGSLNFDRQAKQILYKPVEQALARNCNRILISVEPRMGDNIWLGAIVSAAVATMKKGGTFRLVVNKEDRQFLEESRLNQVFEVYTNESEALSNFT